MKTTECLERAHGALGARAEREQVMFFEQLDTIFLRFIYFAAGENSPKSLIKKPHFHSIIHQFTSKNRRVARPAGRSPNQESSESSGQLESSGFMPQLESSLT